MADLAFREEGGARAEDGAVEVLGEGEGVFEGFDAAGVVSVFVMAHFLTTLGTRGGRIAYFSNAS